MSDLTFNIADYRPVFRVRTHENGPAARTGFRVVSSNSDRQRQQGQEWLDAPSTVVDIRSVREAHRTYPRRGKILRFGNPASHRVYMMPTHRPGTPADDDPGPMVA